MIRSINHDGAIAAAAREDWIGSLLMPRSVSCPSSRHEAVRAALRPADSPTDTPDGLVLTIGIAACRDDVALSRHEEVVNGSCMLHDSCKCALASLHDRNFYACYISLNI